MLRRPVALLGQHRTERPRPRCLATALRRQIWQSVDAPWRVLTRVNRLLPALCRYLAADWWSSRLRNDLADRLLWVLLHIHEHLLATFLGSVPLGHIERSFGFLESFELLYVFNH